MNYAQAKREARARFGSEVIPIRMPRARQEVQYRLMVGRRCIGIGSSWQKAFDSVSEVEKRSERSERSIFKPMTEATSNELLEPASAAPTSSGLLETPATPEPKPQP